MVDKRIARKIIILLEDAYVQRVLAYACLVDLLLWTIGERLAFLFGWGPHVRLEKGIKLKEEHEANYWWT